MHNIYSMYMYTHYTYVYIYTVILISYSHSVYFSVGWFAGCPEPRSQGAARQWQANDLSTDGTDGGDP